MYGHGMRVHTPMKKDNMYRCTMCGKESQKQNVVKENVKVEKK